MKDIEDDCKAHVGKALSVYSKEVPLEQARPIFGLRAVFGEVKSNHRCNPLLKTRCQADLLGPILSAVWLGEVCNQLYRTEDKALCQP